MPIEHINKTDTLNEGREKINDAIDGANAADVTSKAADTKATQALANSESTQTQLDTIVIDGDSSVEAAQARVDEKGVSHPTLKARIDDGLNSVNQQLAQTPQLGINVTAFGAVGDRTSDDRQALQDAIDYLENQGGGTLFLPYKESGYSIQSTHPDYPGSGLIIKSNNIKITSINHTQIWADVDMDKLIHYVDPGFRMHSFSLENIRLEGSQLCNIGIYSDDFIFRTSFNDLYVHNFKDKGMEANVFTAKFNRCIFRQNKNIGIDLNDQTMPGTSVVFIDTNCSENDIGYKLTYVNYSTFISSFGEYSNIVFDIEDCNTLSFVGCGVEHIKQAMRVKRGSGVEVGSFYMGEMGYNGEAPNKYIFEFENVSGGHFGGTNRQETLYSESKMVGITDCRDFTMKYGRIHKFRNQVDFIRSQVTVLDEVARTTTSVSYYIDPNNGSDYADYDNHGTHPDSAFRSWRKVKESLPKNVDHYINVVLMGNLDETIDLKGVVASELLQITGDGYEVNDVEVEGCIGDVNVRNLNVLGDTGIRHSQGVRLSELSANIIEVRYTSGLLIENTEVNELLRLRNGSSAQCLNITGAGDMEASASIIFSSGTLPTGEQREVTAGKIFRP